ncbi:SAM-dependent methyltransferase [Candidatus Chlorohelix allophototropha]|uniref:SAM-dependent methyltransferase n=2 Tax=Candidatus Chlorohelix allophototropha TaxID=3003348 RepID=A0ABY9B6R5_9CHLR|nr:SAM-dependent methyltransferase [Chloroflexota bacterium L227-S17]
MITPTESEDNQIVKAALMEILQQKNRLTFAEFMELALYHPKGGYYNNRSSLIGARGDFYTAPQLTPVFGELIALQLKEMWERLGQPSNFAIVEMGAGQGTLAGDILLYLKANAPQLWENLVYRIVEISPILAEAQAHRIGVLPDGADLLKHVAWVGWDEIASDSVIGCFLSNELVDAFPVHLVSVSNGKLQEIYLTQNEAGELVEETGELSTPALETYFKTLGLDIASYEEDYRTEVNLHASPWLSRVAEKLQRGYILTIDYGYEAKSRFHPRRMSGTLQCYYRHQVSHNPYLNLGNQDITAHVDFSTLLNTGVALGLTTPGLISQAEFLGGLGIGEHFVQMSASTNSPNEVLAQREALLRLISPNEMGNFKVLLQVKNAPLEPTLSGWSACV